MRKKLLLIACGLVLPVALLALLEGGLALFGVGEEHLYDDPFVGFAPGSPLFVAQTLPSGERVYVTNPGKRAFFNEQRFPAEKAPGTYRIFALGGSTTAGRPYDDRVSFSRWLERYATAADPTRRWEVINAGADSYASYRIVVLMKELVHYSPDLFVVYTGHNEFLEERSYPQFAHQSPALLRLRTWLSGFRFAALARQALAGVSGGAAKTVLPDEVTTRLDVWKGLDAFHRDDALERDVVEHFDANLERMVALARDHGVGLVFVAPVSNLKDFSPFKSEHRADLAEKDRARFEAAFGEGKADLADGDPRAALARFDEATAIDPDYADLHFRRGRALFALGDFAAARAAFVRAKDLDVAPLRALEPIVAAVGEVARRHGVPLIDLPALLAADCRAKYGHDVLGEEYLVDHVHPDMAVHSLIAERLLDVLVERGAAHPGASWSAAARQRIYDREVASLDRRYYAERDLKLAKVLGWAGKLEEAEPPLLRAAEVLTDDPDLHLELGTLYEKTGRFQPAAGELERAVALDPASPPAHFNLGVTYGQLGRFTDGIGQLQEALRLRPDYAEALYNLGVLQREAGDLPAAIATLERVRAIRPGAAEVHRALGLAYRLAGRDADAATELTEAVRLDPRAGTTHTELAVALARQGLLDEAAGELKEAIAADPSDAEAWYNLGLLESGRGHTADALAAYRQAIAANPHHAPAHNNLGIALAGRGDLAGAERELQAAIEADPGYAEAHLNLGVVYDQTGRRADAVAEVEQRPRPQPPRPPNPLRPGHPLPRPGPHRRRPPPPRRRRSRRHDHPPGDQGPARRVASSHWSRVGDPRGRRARGGVGPGARDGEPRRGGCARAGRVGEPREGWDPARRYPAPCSSSFAAARGAGALPAGALPLPRPPDPPFSRLGSRLRCWQIADAHRVGSPSTVGDEGRPRRGPGEGHRPGSSARARRKIDRSPSRRSAKRSAGARPPHPPRSRAPVPGRCPRPAPGSGRLQGTAARSKKPLGALLTRLEQRVDERRRGLADRDQQHDQAQDDQQRHDPVGLVGSREGEELADQRRQMAELAHGPGPQSSANVSCQRSLSSHAGCSVFASRKSSSTR